MSLTDTLIRNRKPPTKTTKLSDGGGLYLHLTPRGSKLWRVAYRFSSKQKTLAFGAYPAVSLADARRKRDEAKSLIAAKIDPSNELRNEKLQQQIAANNSYGDIAEKYLAKCRKEGKAAATMQKKEWMYAQVKHALSHRPINDITAPEILKRLRDFENRRKYETAVRLREEIGQVFRYAIASGFAENDPTFGLRGALVTPKVQHRAALTEREDFAGLLQKV